MSRLIILSNRSETWCDNIADPLLISLKQILRRYSGLWFGWNGEIVSDRR